MAFPAYQIRMPPELRQTVDERLARSSFGSLNKYILACIEVGSAILEVLPTSLIQQVSEETDEVKKFKIVKAYFDAHHVVSVEMIVEKKT